LDIIPFTLFPADDVHGAPHLLDKMLGRHAVVLLLQGDTTVFIGDKTTSLMGVEPISRLAESVLACDLVKPGEMYAWDLFDIQSHQYVSFNALRLACEVIHMPVAPIVARFPVFRATLQDLERLAAKTKGPALLVRPLHPTNEPISFTVRTH